MEEKKTVKISLGALVSSCIIISLIIALGVVYYFGIIKNNEKIKELEKSYQEVSSQLESEKNVLKPENQLNDNEILGKYVYQVPQHVFDEAGNVYEGINIELLTNNKFRYYIGEGILLFGSYEIDKDNIICYARTIGGDYLKEQELNVKYTFKYSNNILELKSKEGKIVFETTNYGIDDLPTEIKEWQDSVFETTGSKYIKE